MDTTSGLATSDTPNLPLAAFAIAAYEATLIRTKVEGRRVYFFLQFKKSGPAFEQIESDFNSDGFAPSRTYSDILRHLKGIVSRALDAQERGR